MRISRRAGIALFLAALFSSFVMKYPLFKAHQGNWDSSFILYLSKSISIHGSAPWIANWSSYFGFHELSYPQGIPFLMSAFQQISGLFDPDSVALITNYLEGFMAVLFSFALSLAIRKKDYLFAFFVSFLFSTAPAYVQFTGWTVSARGFISTLLPLYLLVNIFIFKKQNSMRSIIFLNVLFLAVFFSIHRMAFFVLATAIPAVILTSFFTGKGEYYGRLSIIWHSIDSRKRYFMGILLLLAFMYLIYLFYTQYHMIVKIQRVYKSGTIISGSAVYVILINLSFAFAGSGGLLVPFAALSFFYIFLDKRKNAGFVYITIFFIFSLFTIFYPLYFRPFESLLLSLFTALFFIIFIYRKHMRTARKSIINMKTIAVMLVIAVLFSGFMQIRWNKWEPENPAIHAGEELETTIRSIPGEPVFVYPNALDRPISLLSDKMSFSPGFKPYYVYTSYGLLNPNSLNLSFSPYTSWSGRVYLYSENSDFGDVSEKYHNLSTYKYATVKNGIIEDTTHISNRNIFNKIYKIYDNSVYSIFYVDPTSEDVSRTKVWF